MNPARRPLIAGNWKMNLGGPGACDLAAEVAGGVRGFDGVDVVICPPFTALAAVAAELDETNVALGAQNMHPRASGAYTGEVSAPMLLACGVTWVIVGHSERRGLFGESDHDVEHKTEAALEAGLLPIVCVGETLAERQEGRTHLVIEAQMNAVLETVANGDGRVVIAYEPIWAIGTGLNATPDQAQEVHKALRAMLAQRGSALADRTRLLYGGSVRGDNARDLLSEPDVDGALVGGASLDARSFLAIVQAARGLGPHSAALSFEATSLMLNVLLTILHIIASLFLILVVLLQQGKAGGMGALGGAAAQQVFGGGGAGNLLTRLTTAFAAVFMVTSISLAYLASAGDIKLKAKPVPSTAPLPTFSLSTPAPAPPPPPTAPAGSATP